MPVTITSKLVNGRMTGDREDLAALTNDSVSQLPLSFPPRLVATSPPRSVGRNTLGLHQRGSDPEIDTEPNHHLQ